MPSQVTNYQCPACTGPLHFAGDSGKLECDYCGSAYEISEIEALYQQKEEQAVKAHEDAQTKGAEDDGWDTSGLSGDWGADAAGMKAYNCPSCGAELICDESTAATSCPYCGNPTVVPGQFGGTLRPDFVLPFKLSKEDAVAALKKHYKGKVFLPKSFTAGNHIQEIKGVYVPFWMFDGEAEGDARYAATRSRTYRSGDYEVTETEHYDVFRSGSVAFEKVPVDASSKMPDDYMDSIEPYDYTELKPFSTAYLPGFLADKFDVTVEQSRERADKRCENTLAAALRDTVKGYNTCTSKGGSTSLKRGKVHYALMPVWMLNTKWNGKDFLFAMNGQTGRLVGELPVSRGRFWALFAAIAVPLSVLLALTFCIPAAAAEDYGVIYDETGQLGSEPLRYAGEVTLPALTERYGVDLRVDILTESDYDTVLDAAEGIYEEYEYGYGKYHSGITLTLLLTPCEDAYTMAADDWCVYLGGTDENLLYGDWLYDLTKAVEPYLSVESGMESGAWSGNMDMSAVALSQAVDAMAEFVADFFAPGDSGYEMTGGPSGQDTEEPDSTSMYYIFDISDLLPFDQWEELEQWAGDISRRHGCGVYVVLVDDYEDFGSGDVYDVTTQIYHSEQNGFGMGDGRDGIMILLSMAERDYAMFVYGKSAGYAFNEYGQGQLEESFLGDFGNDDWYGGISHYLDSCDEYLAKADAGHPVRANPLWGIGLMTFLSCLAALAVCMVLKRKMNNVRQNAQANEYIVPGGLRLADSYDRYTHTTKTRTKIEQKSSSSSSSSSSCSGGGGSGRSGKF